MANKVLFTASTFSHIHNFHLPYLNWFRSQGWEIHVACGGYPCSLPMAKRITILPFKKKMSSHSNFSASLLLRQQILDENYDLICTHTSLAAFFTRLALFHLTCLPPLVNMVHGYLFDADTSLPKRALLLGAEQLTARYTDLVLTMNRWDYNTACHYQLGKQVISIPGVGVDFSHLDRTDKALAQSLRCEHGVPDDGFLLVYAAEFSARKSQAVLLHALTHLPNEVWLVLPGDGDKLDECRILAQKLGISHRVIFPGYVSHIGLWYTAANAAVSASRSEGLPFNIMESMYMGLPIVASEVKGHVDLLENEVTGLLYPYGDDIACAAQIAQLLDPHFEKEKLTTAARHAVELYRLENVQPTVTDAYSLLFPAKKDFVLHT